MDNEGQVQETYKATKNQIKGFPRQSPGKLLIYINIIIIIIIISHIIKRKSFSGTGTNVPKISRRVKISWSLRSVMSRKRFANVDSSRVPYLILSLSNKEDEIKDCHQQSSVGDPTHSLSTNIVEYVFEGVLFKPIFSVLQAIFGMQFIEEIGRFGGEGVFWLAQDDEVEHSRRYFHAKSYPHILGLRIKGNFKK
jgi:hypothetical protein